MTQYFTAKELMTPPTERAAFSDRQAYVCAELSKLAYFKFEGGFILDEVLAIAKGFVKDSQQYTQLVQRLTPLLTVSSGAGVAARQAFDAILKAEGFDDIETYSQGGTQAFFCTREIMLASRSTKKSAYLVFRGTEKDIRDIKTDISAKLITVMLDGETEPIEFHSGYYQSFCDIRDDIESILKKTTHDQLFITGHSLGGALAVVTTRVMAASVDGACYTFGAPPVGAIEVQNRLKTPVYHIINEVDIVPRLPNPMMAWGTVAVLKIVRIITKAFTIAAKIFSGAWDEKLEDYIKTMTKYRHPGYVSYLVGSGSKAYLRFNVDVFDRFKWWSAMIWKMRLWQIKKVAEDHFINNYIEKLKQHALKRL